MTNALAVAAVTTTLRSLLTTALGGVVNVTAKPLDEARQTAFDQVNLFLYQVAHNAALRNTPMPGQIKPGESGHPPLALSLYYLVTAYGQNNEDDAAHRLLGQAMSALHDHPLLHPDEIRSATQASLPDSDLHTQIERVRVTPQTMPTEEMSKLWAAFQTQYRISAAYQVSVLLIESTRPARTPLPALGRGTQADEGVATQPDVTTPFPTLLSVETPDPRFGALLGDTLTLRGLNLAGAPAAVRLSHPVLNIEQTLNALLTHTDEEITVAVPNVPADFPPGFWTVAVEVTRPGEPFNRTTNRQGFVLAPRVTNLPASFARDVQGLATVVLNFEPEVRPAQRAALLLGDREIPAEPHPAQTGTLTFRVTNPPPAASPAPVEHFARLRVDGVDSILVDRSGATPVFNVNQKVTIT
ncbi:MAG TPA: DUF4255 domain-containing protein [Pyrinomonadaceae bacterium]|nr:DUF4255 domain-containing protein [Pyrinomonadaceae bacterium]